LIWISFLKIVQVDIDIDIDIDIDTVSMAAQPFYTLYGYRLVNQTQLTLKSPN